MQEGESRILLECGIPFKRLQAALDYRAQDLTGCLITHEHKDHAGHVGQLVKRGVPVWASPGTVQALGLDGIAPLLMFRGKPMGAPLRVGGMTVVPFRTVHDAQEPGGYLIQGADGDKLCFATDTAGLGYRFPGTAVFALEANYEERLLERHTRIPDGVIKRIRNSHMEITRLCEFLEKQDLGGCRAIWLLHLSDASSSEMEFIYQVRRATGGKIPVRVAQK